MAKYRDRFGGFTDVISEATGFFRVEEIDGRWWLMTPEGNAFVAVGFNHADSRYLSGTYNRQFWEEKLRETSAFPEMVLADAHELNMTMLGYGGPDLGGRLPYVKRINFPIPSLWADRAEFPDVFSDEFRRACERVAWEVCEARAADPALIGYFFNDVPEWPVPGRASKRRAGNWLDALKGLGPEAPGKAAYVDLMRQRHGSIADLNLVYGTDLRSFDELAQDLEFFRRAPLRPDAVREDDETFLTLLADRYYEVAVGTVRRIDGNHLLLGDIHDGNRGIPPQVLAALRQRTDVLSVQYYGFFRDQVASLSRWHAKTGLPILLADSCFSIRGDMIPRPCGVRLESHEERAQEFERYARQALATPFVLGWCWCGYIDGSLELEPRRQHMGLRDAWGNPHQPLWSRVRETYANLYELACLQRRSR